jgi:chorismate mutase
MVACRGVRGAITVDENSLEAILAATRTLLETIVAENGMAAAEIAGVTFTATADLDAVYPAVAARALGWVEVPLLCMQEMRVVGSLERCIRVLLHWNTDRTQAEIRHVYLGEARRLRPDLVREG